jgi:hypothetical protein
MEDSRRYLRQASEQLDASVASVRDVGARATLSVLASELADVCEGSLSRADRGPEGAGGGARDGGRADLERVERTLESLELRLSGSAGVSVRRARRSLERYRHADA